MGSQTLLFSSTPKLATFNSRTTPPPPLAFPSPRAFDCSSSLPTLTLKAFNFGVKPLHTSDFKCYASVTDEKAVIISADHHVGAWEDIPDVEHNEQVQALGQFAVDEENKKPEHAKSPIKFMRVVEAERQLMAGTNYRLWVEGEVDKVDKVFKALVFVGLPVVPKELQSFNPVEWFSFPSHGLPIKK